jgi:hypothetical protein
MKRTEFPGAANRLHLQRPSRWSVDRVLSAIRCIARGVASEHALALRATTKAALPRKNQADLRAMCVTPLASHRQDEGSLTPESNHPPAATRRVQVDWPCWSSPFPKPRK